MSEPINACTEIVKCWFAKRLEYLVDESRPIKLNRTSSCSDIDMICIHPSLEKVTVKFVEKEFSLEPRLLVEIKGWEDYSKLKYLYNDMKILKAINNAAVIPKNTIRSYNFNFLREEFFKEGKEIFGSRPFQRVIVTSKLESKYTPRKKSSIEKKEVIDALRKKGVIIIEIQDILHDLFKYIKSNKKKKGSEEKTKLRKDFTLELFYFIEQYNKDIFKNIGEKN